MIFPARFWRQRRCCAGPTSEILKAHLDGCVKQAFETGDEAEKQKKIQEIIEVFDALSR